MRNVDRQHPRSSFSNPGSSRPVVSPIKSGRRFGLDGKRETIMRRLFALFLILLPLPLAALEVRVHPGEVVYAYEADPAHGLYTVMLQNIAIVQKDGDPVTLDSLEIQAVSNGQTVQTLVLSSADLDKSVQRLN